MCVRRLVRRGVNQTFFSLSLVTRVCALFFPPRGLKSLRARVCFGLKPKLVLHKKNRTRCEKWPHRCQELGENYFYIGVAN